MQSLSGLFGEPLIPTAKPERRPTCQFLGPGHLVNLHLQSNRNAANFAGRWTPGMPSLAGDTLHVPPSVSLCHGSLWMCKGIWHLAMSKLETSREVWMSSPLRRSQKADGCRAADCRTALHAIQSREQSLEHTLPRGHTEPVIGIPVRALLPNRAAPCPSGMAMAPHLIEFPGHHSLSLQLRGTIALPATPRSPRGRRG